MQHTTKHIVTKLWNTQNGQKILKAFREKECETYNDLQKRVTLNFSTATLEGKRGMNAFKILRENYF